MASEKKKIEASVTAILRIGGALVLFCIWKVEGAAKGPGSVDFTGFSCFSLRFLVVRIL